MCSRSIRMPAPPRSHGPRSPVPPSPAARLARRYGVSAETIRKWRKRGASNCLDRSARPHHLPWKASGEERAVVCALRRSTNFALDDLTFVVTHFLPHLNRDSIWRILKARPQPQAASCIRQTGSRQGNVLGLRSRLDPYRHQAPAQAAGHQWRAPQALTVRRLRPALALGAPGRQG
jgi:hypothetical protein